MANVARETNVVSKSQSTADQEAKTDLMLTRMKKDPAAIRKLAAAGSVHHRRTIAKARYWMDTVDVLEDALAQLGRFHDLSEGDKSVLATIKRVATKIEYLKKYSGYK